MAEDKYILTLDAGTGSGRAVLFDLAGNQLAVSQEEWYPVPLEEYPGSQAFDTEEAWAILVRCIKGALEEAGARPEQVAGITATSMREGFVLYDAQGVELWACTNGDARAADEVVELTERGLGPGLYERGGDWFAISAPPRLLWIKRHQPEVYTRTAHLTMLGDWVLYRLTGEFVTDPTLGSSSGLFDLETRTWSQETIEIFELPQGIYPPVLESGTQMGTVSQEAAQQTGLLAGTPVITSGGDTQLALTGVGAVNPLDYTVVGGSFWQTTVVTSEPVIDPEIRVRALCHTVPGQWMTEGIGFLHGFASRWLRDGFCHRELELAEARGVDAYALLEEMAQEVPPGSHGLIVVFSDLMNAKRWKHAAPSFIQIDIFSPQTCGKKEFFRALEENAAYVSNGHYQMLEALTGATPEQVTFCAGSSKGFLWPQIMADVYGLPMRVPVVKEATALGAAMCVGVGLGEYSDLQDATGRLVRWERFYEPDLANHEIYKEYYQKWRSIYPRMLALVEEGMLEPMWRAPGT
jgi:autoinducer 2 (AI-2) kinase